MHVRKPTPLTVRSNQKEAQSVVAAAAAVLESEVSVSGSPSTASAHRKCAV